MASRECKSGIFIRANDLKINTLIIIKKKNTIKEKEKKETDRREGGRNVNNQRQREERKERERVAKTKVLFCLLTCSVPDNIALS